MTDGFTIAPEIYEDSEASTVDNPSEFQESLNDEIQIEHFKSLFEISEEMDPEIVSKLEGCNEEIADCIVTPVLLLKGSIGYEGLREQVRDQHIKNYEQVIDALSFLENLSEGLYGEDPNIQRNLVVRTIQGGLSIGIISNDHSALGQLGEHDIDGLQIRILRERDQYTSSQINFRLLEKSQDDERTRTFFQELGSMRVDLHHVKDENQVQVDVDLGPKQGGISEKHQTIKSLSHGENTLENFQKLEDVFLVNLVEHVIAEKIETGNIVPKPGLIMDQESLETLGFLYLQAKQNLGINNNHEITGLAN